MMLFQQSYYYLAARTTIKTSHASRNAVASFLGVTIRKGNRALSTPTNRRSVISRTGSSSPIIICTSTTTRSSNNCYHTSPSCWKDGASPLSSVGTNLSSREGSNSRKIYFDGYTASGVDVLGMMHPETNHSAIMVRVQGSFVAFHTSIYSWNLVYSTADIRNIDPFQLFLVRQPKLDVLLIGIPPHQPRIDPQVFQTIRSEFSKRGTTVECLDWVRF